MYDIRKERNSGGRLLLGESRNPNGSLYNRGKMEIKILGIGGFINDGYAYNSFLLNGDFLIETPPDIMQSLYRNEHDYKKIKRIFISHEHGDHIFGMPFITLNLFKYYLTQELPSSKIEIIGPRGIKERIYELQVLATSPDNPSVEWMGNIYKFVEINEETEISLNKECEINFFKTNHSKETYGIKLKRNGELIFVYTADTKWDEKYINVLKSKPKYCICDLNSNGDDSIKAHMSEKDITNYAIPVTGSETKYIGTHISKKRKSTNEFIEYAYDGAVYKI